MARLDEEKFKEQLRQQGFSRVYVWQDAVGVLYPKHSHEGLTAHIIFGWRDDFEYAGQLEDLSCWRTVRCSCGRGACRSYGPGRLPLYDWGKMTIPCAPRPLSSEELELAEFLLSVEFRGRDELHKQLESAQVTGTCECGCGTICSRVNDLIEKAATT